MRNRFLYSPVEVDTVSKALPLLYKDCENLAKQCSELWGIIKKNLNQSALEAVLRDDPDLVMIVQNDDSQMSGFQKHWLMKSRQMSIDEDNRYRDLFDERRKLTQILERLIYIIKKEKIATSDDISTKCELIRTAIGSLRIDLDLD